MKDRGGYGGSEACIVCTRLRVEICVRSGFGGWERSRKKERKIPFQPTTLAFMDEEFSRTENPFSNLLLFYFGKLNFTNRVCFLRVIPKTHTHAARHVYLCFSSTTASLQSCSESSKFRLTLDLPAESTRSKIKPETVTFT